MTNRPAALLVISLLAASLLALVFSGCKRSTAESAGGTEGGDQYGKVLEDIRNYEQDTGKNVQALVDEIKRRQALEVDKGGEPPVARDLAVARAALTDAQQAAEAKNGEATEATLRRLKRVLLSLSAELPGAIIVQHVDRALYIIRCQQGIGSREFMAASLALLAASDAAISGRPAALVPDVLKDLEAGKTAVDKGNAEEAIKSLQAATDKAVAHPAAGLLNRAMAAARGAEEALYRQAWPVVVAELTEIDDRLAELSKSVAPPSTTTETTKPAAEAAPGGQAAPSTGEAGQGAAPPATPAPEAGAQTPPAATPAAGGEAAPARGQTERTKSAPPARAPRASQPQQQAPPAQPPAGS